MGAVLLQEGRPIAYASKSLTDTEKRYANIDRELLAVVFGAERFRTYVYGKHFVVESDHKPLEMIQLKNLMAAPTRLQRMLLRIQHYDITIKYRPGKEFLLADGLSRLPNPRSREETVIEQQDTGTAEGDGQGHDSPRLTRSHHQRLAEDACRHPDKLATILDLP